MIRSRGGRSNAVLLMLLVILPLSTLGAQSVESWAPVYDIRDTDWRVIETANYDILFSAPLEDEAQELARSFEKLIPALQQSLTPKRNYRYTIILEAESFTSNGYVRIFPRASLYYSLPFASAGGDWYSLLAIHEGRHMIQLDTAEQGPMRLLRILFGEQGLLPLFAAPAWILEGDAVAAETIFSGGGRGRDPAFTLQLKAMALEESSLSYQSAILGSYARMTPNAYNLGYLLYTHMRSIHSPQAPDQILEGLASLPLPVLGARRGVRRVAGEDPHRLYREMLDDYGEFWRRQAEFLPQDSYEPITQTAIRDYTIHSHLVPMDAGGFAAAVSSLSRGDEILIYAADGRVERRIRARPATALSAAAGYLVWDEALDDAKHDRRSHRIVRYRIDEGSRESIGAPGRFAYPELSPDGNRLALLEWGRDFKGSVKILDAQTGAMVADFPLQGGEFHSSFDWHPNGRDLLFLSSGLGSSEIGILDTETGNRRILLRSEEELIRDPSFTAEGILYSSTYSGVPALYRLPLNASQGAREPVQLFSGLLGSFSPRQSTEGQLLFIDHVGTEGSVIGRLDTPAARPLSGLRRMREEFFLPLVSQEPALRLPLKGEGDVYPSQPYSPGLEATRLHSWSLLPTSLDPIDEPALGLNLRADSLFGTVGHQLSLEYDTNTEQFESAYSLLLRRYRPDIALTIQQQERTGAALEISLPLGTSVGDRAWRLTPRISAGIEADLGGEDQNPELPVEYGLAASGIAGYGPRSLQPRWGAETEIAYRHEPGAADAGTLLSGSGKIYLPGLFFNHGTRLGGAYEKQDREDPSRIPYARGWEYRDTAELAKISADYQLPIGYPDLPLGGLALFKRLRGGVFAERLYDLSESEVYSSLGTEINLDFNLLQIPVELALGLRAAYRVEEDDYIFQLLIMGGSF